MASFMDSIRALMTGGEAERPVADATSGEALPAVDPLHLAACALLLEVAHADGHEADITIVESATGQKEMAEALRTRRATTGV